MLITLYAYGVIQNDFGKKIKKRRQELKYSLRRVCEQVKNEDGVSISVSYLNDIEQGYRNPPNNKIIVQLANFLNFDSQELLNLADKVHPIVEEVSKEAEVGVLFRQIAEKLKQDPSFADVIKDQLNQDKDKEK